MPKYILYMASGMSTRFGSNKLLSDFQGKPLYRHGLDTLKAVADSRQDCQLRLISRYSQIREYALSQGIPAIDAPDSILGASYTIKAGILSIPQLKESDFLLFSVADQPLLTAKSVNRLLDAGTEGTQTARLFFEDQPGNPVLFSASLAPELLTLTGDSGGGKVAKLHSCEHISVENPAELWDIDRISDLNHFSFHP